MGDIDVGGCLAPLTKKAAVKDMTVSPAVHAIEQFDVNDVAELGSLPLLLQTAIVALMVLL